MPQAAMMQMIMQVVQQLVQKLVQMIQQAMQENQSNQQMQQQAQQEMQNQQITNPQEQQSVMNEVAEFFENALKDFIAGGLARAIGEACGSGTMVSNDRYAC
jgi:uncharacterized protein with von Willebrand factor type A (vWA) domain